MSKQKITRARWTKNHVNELKEFVSRDLDNHDIARRMNRTPLAIYTRRLSMGLNPGKHPGRDQSQLAYATTATRILWGPSS